ncbi:MAG: phage holin family protein [Chitinophagales bacterium]|nr:phage holin family protein [Bacteroidota bacterium]MCB9044287.1 phage holin family protein [Chitinophagales bacterium]
MNTVINILINAAALYLTAYLLPGATFNRPTDAIILAIVLAIINTLVKPIANIIFFPVTVITFGLFMWVINALMLYLADYFVSGFQLSSFWVALLFSLVMAVVNALLFKLVRKD